VSNNILHHCPGDERLSTTVGLAFEQLLSRQLGRQSKRCQRVHNQVNPQHLHGPQRRLGHKAGANKSANNSNHVDGKLKLQELGDRIVHVTTPHHSLDNRVEVVVDQNNIRRLLGHRCALDAHRESNVGLLKRRTVVSAVASHRDHLTVRVQLRRYNMLDKLVLILWRRAGQHSQTRPDQINLFLDNIALLILDTLVELLALHDQEVVVNADDAARASDRPGRIDIIAGDHTHDNTGAFALADSLGHFGPDWILNGANAQTSQAAVYRLFLFVEEELLGKVGIVDSLGMSLWDKVPVGHSDGSQAVRGHWLDHIADSAVVIRLGELLDSVRCLHVLALQQHHL